MPLPSPSSPNPSSMKRKAADLTSNEHQEKKRHNIEYMTNSMESTNTLRSPAIKSDHKDEGPQTESIFGSSIIETAHQSTVLDVEDIVSFPDNETDEEDIEKAIELHRELLKLHATSHPDHSTFLSNLAKAVTARFEQQGDTNDIDEAIELFREALQLRAAPHPDRDATINNLAVAIQTRFKEKGDPKDIDEAIELYREALKLQVVSHPEHGMFLNNLAMAIEARFEQQGHLEDLDQAIEYYREALEHHAAPHPDRSISLSNLATAVESRFELNRDSKDLDFAINLYREAVELNAAPHIDRSMSLNNLANALYDRFEQQGDLKDIDEAIKHHREALELRAAPDPDRSTSISNLANAVHSRFEQQGDLKDLDEAIELHREALEFSAALEPDHSTSLNNLAAALQTRDVLQFNPAHHPDRSMFFNNLATALEARFLQQGDLKDVDEAIELHRDAMGLRSAPHPSRSNSLNNLATALHTRFKQKGDTKDIDEAIKLHREALDLRAAPHPNRTHTLSSLANTIMTRFDLWGDLKDINEAIELHRSALKLCVPPHSHRGTALNNLATAIQIRFREQKDPRDINEAIELHKEALKLHAAPHPDCFMSLNNLALAIETRFQQQGNLKDIDEAIELHREAVKLCSAPHPERSKSLSNLANAVHSHFEQQRDPKDLDEAIELHREALELRAPPHPDRCTSLNNLALAVGARFEKQRDSDDIDEAIELIREASTNLSFSPFARFHASRTWVTLAASHNHNSSLAAYHTRIDLLPQLAALHLDLNSREQMLTRSEITSLASASAMYAIGLNQNNIAVEFLEASRSIFWAQALHLQTPLEQLANVEPDLAAKLRGLSRQLEQASFRDTSRNLLIDTQHKAITIEAEAAHCRRLNEDWDEAVKSVRMLSGFGDFMLPKSIASLCQAAISGPIVILLASKETCSALIMTPSRDIQHLQLPKMNLPMLKIYVELFHALSKGTFDINHFLANRGYAEDSGAWSDFSARLTGAREGSINISSDTVFEELLGVLWTDIVKQVFDYLTSLNQPDLLVYGAGIYTGDTDSVADYVVSSYIPTLAALLDPPTETATHFKVTAVVEPHAPNCTPLPGTVAELKKITNRVSAQWITTLHNTTGAMVMEHLQDSSIVHFACHGVQDPKNPLDSGLMLSDGRLKVSQIMHKPNTDRHKKAMSLAFLSACETAKGDTNTPDEAMHLAATLLFVGFRGVVATMWTINDEDGPKIADLFYEYLFKDCDLNSSPPVLPDLTKAAEGLHLAVAKLRKEPGITFKRWVPFVHYGL
ncbi:CHAT domain-containing protein [Mycena pura]|uniref:CHAT domain-containing protein n=1 Tax=Mycena pura TaxID=153505 RepID=A0AAD6UZV4_9AGAR|nr:CHAT domain-containing protein [Mycena pura]